MTTALTIAAAGAAWLVLRSRLEPRNLGEVVPGTIWRAGRLTPRTLRLVRDRCRIKTIVDLGAYWPASRDEARMQRAAADLGLTRHSIRGLRGDATGNPNAYVYALQTVIRPDAGPVLVMCAAGADRTGAAIALYRAIVQGWSIDAALEESARHQHDPARNPAMHAWVRGHVEAIRAAILDGEAVAGHAPADVTVNPLRPHLPVAAPAA